MKKIFLIIFVVLCSLIFYQIILGKNGIIEGERIKNEREIVTIYYDLLKEELGEYDDYITRLKNDPGEYDKLANGMGFFEEGTSVLTFSGSSGEVKKDDFVNTASDKKFQEYLEKNANDHSLQQIRLMVSVVFYLFFGFFVVLIIFSGQNTKE